IYWSVSASATSMPIVPETPEIEEPSIIEEAPVKEVVIPEPVVVEEPVVEPIYGSISVYGYPLSWKFVPGTIEITYPSFVLNEEVEQFIAFTSVNNAQYFDGVFYDIKESGKAVITLSEAATYEDVEFVGTRVISDLFDFINLLFAPKAAEVEEVANTPEPDKYSIPVITLPEDVASPTSAKTEEVVAEPVVEEVATPVEPAPVAEEVVVEELPVATVTVEPVVVPATKSEKAPFRFTLSLAGGAGVNTPDFKTLGKEFKLGLGMGFENFISFNKTVGLSLQLNGGADLKFASFKNLFSSFNNVVSLSSYSKDLYAEALLGLTFNSAKLRTHLSGGARFIFAGVNEDNILGNWKLLNKQFGITVAPMASFGMRYDFTKHFGMGLDVNYAYIMTKSSNNAHDIDGRVYMSLVF
ncbi:MAG: hypothetical protein PUC01_00725, partial [Spirochaetales bacterium]|nr:hypothetical protein [Spirochaetales bacterium]